MTRKREYSTTEMLGLNAAERIVLEMGWIWRNQPVLDFGIDAHIEVVDKRPTGKLIGVQMKTGASYFKGNASDIVYYVDEEHMAYWDGHVLPVILILHNPETGETLWQRADTDTARRAGDRWRIDVPRMQAFNTLAKPLLLNKEWGNTNRALRRRFAIDRELMKEFRDREAYATLEIWVNKSLKFRGIEIRFDDPYKSEVDYEFEFLATWGYSIDEVMDHFLPWLDREYYEEPEDNNGEVEGHLFSVWLNKGAKAYLELEDFFESPRPTPADENDDAVIDPDREPWPDDGD